MIVLGIDPGFASFGYSVVELTPAAEVVQKLGVIRTEKSDRKRNVMAADDNIRRGRQIADELSLIWSRHHPDCLCAEAMSFPRSSSVAGKMCIAWGIVICFANSHALPIVEASPQAVKLAVAGSKQASKDNVQAALVKRFGAMVGLGLGDLPTGQHEHPFDALAAVVACLDSDVIRMGRRAAS